VLPVVNHVGVMIGMRRIGEAVFNIRIRRGRQSMVKTEESVSLLPRHGVQSMVTTEEAVSSHGVQIMVHSMQVRVIGHDRTV
jgi:hypothetical protein